MLQVILSGVIAGGLYAAIAVGLTVSFGVMDIVNFAHGGFVVLGAFVAIVATRTGAPLFLAILIAMAAIALLGAALELGLFRFTLDKPFNGLVISVGILAVIEQSVVELFGPDAHPLHPFTYGAIHFLGVTLAVEHIIIGAVGFLAVVAYWAVIRFTRFGLYTRAVAQDREMAALLGLRYTRQFSVNFAVGAALAGMAGALLATIQPVSAFSAEGPTFTAFTVVIIGTLGSVPGVIVAGVLLGLVQNLGISYVSPSFASIYPFLLIMVVLAFRPAGLFGGHTLKRRVA